MQDLSESIHENLESKPPMNGIIFLDDDATIKALLVQHSMSANLEPNPALPLPFRYNCVWIETPFLYAVKRFVGYPDEEDNGYRALLIPVEQNTEQEMDTLVRGFIDEGTDWNRKEECISEYRKVNAQTN